MKPDQTGDRRHGAADFLIILATVALTVATWASFSGISGVAVWKSYTSVAVTLLLALAALTRNPNWAAAIRVLTGIWLMGAPFLLRFEGVMPARWAYLVVGATVILLAIPGFTARQSGRTPVVV
jgi:hypothetical protein